MGRADEDYVSPARSPEDAPDKPNTSRSTSNRATRWRSTASRMSPASLLTKLNELGGAHGIGRLDLVENRFVGMKSRGVYETPGGTVLIEARRAVESLCLDRGAMHLKDELMPRYAELIYNGLWFSPEREMLQAAIDESQKRVRGTARVKLFKGHVRTVGRRSRRTTLYNTELATFEADTVYDQTGCGRIH